ncbi:MAG: UDP-3-O-[3-hydroxymyristoyl] N-acetylglucosamine deacetylase [bacterium]|nr:UDP-3-O-[3-hydroxymyristoyl] N-acetylglucosamine deacetylase [bacterium]
MEKVLIIDDEKNIQVSLASILEDEGYQTFFAASGEEGVEKFQNIRPDAVLLDIWLPGIDGLETMKKLLAIDPLQIIIMISGHGNITTAVRAVKDGAYDFLEKPLSLDKVIFVLKRGLDYRDVLAENQRLRSILDEEADLKEKKKLVRENTTEIDFDPIDTPHFKQQKTVKSSNIFYGLGLHSGEKTGMVIKPLPPGKGIRFENISEPGYIPARVEYLDTTSYATSISRDNLEAKTIEHFMATLHAAGITNLSIKINKEVPIGDGSADEFCKFIKNTGIVTQDGVIPEILIDKTFTIEDPKEPDKFIKIEPADHFSVKYTTIYPEPLGTGSYEFRMNSFEDFEQEIAPARTYGFVQELSMLSSMGLAEGGRMHNFILIDQDRIINTELRYKEELARHKILDIIGDFYLLGRPIRGKITAQKTGHTENAQMVNLIKENFF